jgi:iron(III)-enterobactin esterase
MTAQEGVPQGTVFDFTMESADSKIYPGIAREPNTFGTPDPPTRQAGRDHQPSRSLHSPCAVYVPKQYVPGTAAPFIVGADGPDRALFTALDNLIAQHRVPVMIAISIGNGSGDAQGSERGLEYDTMSGLYAEFVEKEVLPLVEKQCQRETDQRSRGPRDHGRQFRRLVRLDHGLVSPGALPPRSHLLRHLCEPAVAAEPETPHGAWEFHEHLIPNSPAKPLRIWMEVGDRDLSIRTSCATTCTTGSSPMRTWPKCWPPRAIITSLSLRATPGTPTAP